MRILVCYTRFPWPCHKGDLLTVFKLLEFLSARHQVDLLTVTPEDGSYLDNLPKTLGSVHTIPNPMPVRALRLGRCLFTGRSLQVDSFASLAFLALRQRLLESGDYDVIYSHYIRSFGHEDFSSYGARKIIGLQLSHQAHFAKAVKKERNPIVRWLYATETRRLEFWEGQIASYNDLIHLISPHDLKRIKNNESWSSRVFFNPHGVDTKDFSPKPSCQVKGRVVFTGNLGFQANEDAVVWLVKAIWPRVAKACPDAELLIAGARPTAAVRSAIASAERVELMASPPSMAEVIQTGEVAIDPLRIGAGLQNKVLEAMACGLPVVATPLANQGIGATGGRDIILAETPEALGDAVVELLQDAKGAAELGKRAREFIERSWTWEYHFRQLEERWLELVDESVVAG